MTDKQELLPCPFCGGEVVLHEAEYDIVGPCVECCNPACMVAQNSGQHISNADAMAAWNSRTPDPELAKVTAERDEALTKLSSMIDLEELQAQSLDVEEARADAAESLLASRTTAIEAERDEAETFVAELQTALSFWLPSVTPEVDAETNGRVAEDAYLLVGMKGDISIAGWTDGLIERFLRSEALLVSRTTTIETAIEALTHTLDDARDANWSYPSLFAQVMEEIGALRAQLRSLIAGKETDVG